MNLRQLIIALYWLLFAGVGAASATFFWQTRAEYNRLVRAEALSQRKLAEAKQRLDEQSLVLKRLQTDPAYVEKIIRQRLGYAKPEEFVFRFEN